MKKVPYLNIALNLANKYHTSQRDKGGEPYILHPLRLMMQNGHY